MTESPRFIPLPAELAQLGKMPCEPAQIALPASLQAPTMFRVAVAGETALRILRVSTALGRWSGVSYLELWTALDAERDAYAELAKKQREADSAENTKLDTAYSKAKSTYIWLCVFTLGIYAACVSVPRKPNHKSTPMPAPTGVQHNGGSHISDGMTMLSQDGLVFVMPSTEPKAFPEQEDDMLLFPTPVLALTAWSLFPASN